MPVINNHTIEILKASEAYSKGYLTYTEYRTHADWLLENFEERYIKRFLYVDAIYLGIVNATDKLAVILEKYRI